MRLRITFDGSYVNRIAGIKFLRELTGAGLKDSKDASDSVTTEERRDYPIGAIVADVDAVNVTRFLLQPFPQIPAGVRIEALDPPPANVFNLRPR
jgi:hypothetical protein